MSSMLLQAIELGGMSLGLFYFICLILSDNWSALRSKPRTWWIPGKLLVLSALSIQVLSILDYSSISFSDVPNAQGVARLLGNQLVIDSGRLVICVFIGYLLPGMATRGSAEASADIVALVVSLFSAIVSELFYVRKAGKIFSKVDYNYVYDFFTELSDNPKIKVWFIVSSSLFLVAIVLLILFLVSAILAGKTVRCILKQRINSAISFTKPNQAEEYWDKFDDEVLKQWLLCRASQPQSVIARSVLISSTGLVVTISIVFFMAKTLKLGSKILHLDDGLDWLRHTTFGLQCVFLLLGGWVIFLRWFRAVIYFPIFFRNGYKSCFSWRQCSVEDFWTRSIIELINMYDLQQWRMDQTPEDDGCSNGIFIKIFTKCKLHKSLYIFWALQKLLVWFSKCCWLISEMLFVSVLMRRAVIGNDRCLFYEADPSDEYQEYIKYKEALEHVCMPRENPASLWLTNKDSVDQANDRIKKGKKSQCLELISLIKKSTERQKSAEAQKLADRQKSAGSHKSTESAEAHKSTERQKSAEAQKSTESSEAQKSTERQKSVEAEKSTERAEAQKSTERQKSVEAQKSTESFVDQLENFHLENFQLVKKYFPTLDDSWWKMAAVSLLIIIIKLDADGRERAIQAYKQAWDLMTFVESSNSEQPNSIIVTQVFDIEADPVNMAADDKFKRLLQNLQDSSRKLTMDESMKVIEAEFNAAKKQLNELNLFIGEGSETPQDMEKGGVRICDGPQDSKDWNKIVPSYSMYRVCKILQCHSHSDIKELVDYLHICLGDVIADCLKRLPKMLVMSFGEWTIEHQDDNMWKAFRIAGKCKQVVQESGLKPNWNSSEEKKSESSEGQNKN